MAEGRFSESTYKVLKKAGWSPKRHAFSTLQLPDGYDLYEPTKLILDEFGGLSVSFTYTLEFNNFRRASIVIDPSLCVEEIEHISIAEHSQHIGHPLYPLAVYYDDYWDPVCSTILIDDLGRSFLVAFWVNTFLGETFDIAVDNLVAGRKGEFIDQNGHWLSADSLGGRL